MLYIKSAMPSEARLCPGTAGFLALPGSTYLVPVKNQKSAMPSEARLCPGTAGFLALSGSTYLVPVKNQKSAMPSEARLCPGTARLLALPGSTYLVPVKNQKSAMPSEARLCPGTAGFLASLRENTLVSCQNQTTAMLRAHAALPWKVFGERCGKHFFSKKGFPRKSSFHSFIFSFFSFFIPLFFPFPISISRSGRRGRMRRHMRDNMASRGRDTGKLRPEGGHRPLFGTRHCRVFGNDQKHDFCLLPVFKSGHESFAEDFSLPLSSPGVFTNPPAKPTGMFFRPNRQWCGALRGGGEGSPRACVSFEQQERTRFNPSAIFCAIADRQQRGRSSGHRRAASSTARTRASWIMDLLDMIKRSNFHIHEAQQNMGTGNAVFTAVPVPVFAATIRNRPMTPLFKTVRAGVARGGIRFMNSKRKPFRCRAGTPAGTARFFTFSAVYHNE